MLSLKYRVFVICVLLAVLVAAVQAAQPSRSVTKAV